MNFAAQLCVLVAVTMVGRALTQKCVNAPAAGKGRNVMTVRLYLHKYTNVYIHTYTRLEYIL